MRAISLPFPPETPDLALERELAAATSANYIAGVDEAGRGALAGPVFAAAVVLPLADASLPAALSEVRDSKLLSPATRERLFPLICQHALSIGIGYAPSGLIDTEGILPATRLAMAEALRALTPAAEAVLVDGPLHLAPAALPQWAVVHGDRYSLSIAAASILAKVSRDRYMVALGERFPDYSFGRHKGYGTVEHRQALGRHGPCPEHRLTFAPLRTERMATDLDG